MDVVGTKPSPVPPLSFNSLYLRTNADLLLPGPIRQKSLNAMTAEIDSPSTRSPTNKVNRFLGSGFGVETSGFG